MTSKAKVSIIINLIFINPKFGSEGIDVRRDIAPVRRQNNLCYFKIKKKEG